MNICYVMESFTLGGVEKVTYQLLSELGHRAKAAGHRYYLKVLDNSGDLKSLFDNIHNVEVSPIEGFLSFRKFCIENQIECVVFTKGGISRYACLLPLSIKTVAIQHVPINLPQVSKLKNCFRAFGAAILYRRMSSVITVSEGIRQNLIKYLRLSEDHVNTIYNAVVDSDVDTVASTPTEYKDYWVFVGRLSYQKGTDMLAKVVQLASEQIPDFKLVIVGSGPEESAFTSQLSSFGVRDRVIIHGFSDNPYQYIKHAKGLLLPSRWEGLPTVLVEAAYLGTQTVSFDCRYGPSELTSNGQNGYLIKQDDVDAFAEAIIAIEKGLQKPMPDTKNFTKSQAAKNYELFVKQLCSQK
ncbi:glycosyltransferase [Pseudoalteromonas sp. CO325X]|uniref:glycosyltransferase n=1 Tax=Pseudoalteromonas sp. CO325X TaxID=1777262 RepID=UPI0010232E8B|nr:glycosyltransferase [Pseudoalteromonas sp. CO325X]RZF79182.1 glycosyltransferase [Pseudoalteromonas sp. CO325X]